MKRALILFITLVVTLVVIVPSMETVAQDDDMCSAEQIAAQINAAYETYNSEISANSDLESSLSDIDKLNAEIAGIYAECDDARYQAYVPEGTELLNDLREGGYVIYARHAATDHTQQDQETIDPEACETQRNLSEQGRVDAAMIGDVWTTLDIPVSRIISTEYCRTRETAALAFGESTVIPKAELVTSLDELLAELPDEGTNVIIVGHVDLLEDATGIQIPEDIRFNEGDALVFRPEGGAMGDGGYELVARIGLRNWSDLGRIVGEGEDTMD